MTHKKRWIILLSILAIAFILIGLKNEFVIRHYSISRQLVTEPLVIAVITDLHGCDYGIEQKMLVYAIDEAAPDLIVLVGDIIDDKMPLDKSIELLDQIGNRYPCYYVSGNHEFWSGDIKALKELIRDKGIVVLEGDHVSLKIRDQEVDLYGIDDLEVGKKAWKEQLSLLGEHVSTDTLSILLAHRPEMIKDYAKYGFNVVIAGHAHGGQWRLPGILNGLFAPNQGLFPKYAGGHYKVDDTEMIVSRGLAKESTRVPRIYNPPELVIVTFEP